MLYAQGLINGVVVDSGDGVTHIVPVWDNTCPTHLIKRLDVAGRHVTQYLIKLLQVRLLPSSLSQEIYRHDNILVTLILYNFIYLLNIYL